MRIVPRQHQIFPKLLGLAWSARSRALIIACVPRGAVPVRKQPHRWGVIELGWRSWMFFNRFKGRLANSLKDLRAAQDRLIRAEKLAALGRLVAGVAHEINSPIGTSLTIATSMEIKGKRFAEEIAQGELRRSSLNNFLESSRDAFSQMTVNLNRAAELISSFKQLAADRTQSDQRPFDLGDLTKQVAKSLRSTLHGLSPTLNVECQPNIAMNSYPGPYSQVLTNLFLNAATHAFPDRRPGTIDIKAREFDEDNVEIVFSDDGCGMSPEIRRQAFDPFFTTRRDAGRAGLGLHIVCSLVTNSLGGRIVLETSPEEGTRIQIILPRVMSLPLVTG
jgi:C4-dicarboxylate-specific signal transduction histidine kinase